MNKKLKKYIAGQMKKIDGTNSLTRLKEQQKKMNDSSKQCRRGRLSFIIGVGFSIVTLVVILLCVYFIKIEDENIEKEPRAYLEENLSVEAVTMETLNEELPSFSFSKNKYCINSIKRYNDKYYGETLFYSIEYTNDEGLIIDFIVLTNTDYNIEFEHQQYTKKDSIIGYEINYTEIITEDDGIYFITVKGEIVFEKEVLYITVELVSFAKEYSLKELLDKIIVNK